MAGRDRWLTSKRLALLGVVFGLFVVFDISLFAWLIFESLSQREIEEVLLETQEQARPIAETLEARAETQESEDLFVIVTIAQETQTYIDDVLADRELVRTVRILDKDGTVVYSKEAPAVHSTPEDLAGDDPPRVLQEGPESTLEAEIPIGDGLGTLVIGLSEEQVQQRIGVLRRELTRQASTIGALTVTLLGFAVFALLKLVRRARRFETQAQEAERMAYVGTLASGLAHEIRSPLNSLSLNMQMLEEEADESERGAPTSSSARRLLSITRSEIARLERLASDFLTYAKPRSLELERVAMVELLYRARDVLAAEIDARKVAVEVEDETGGAEIEVDPGQMKQLILNLIQNALGAMEHVQGPRVLRLAARRSEGAKLLEVTDTGTGIAEEQLEKIFDLFYSQRKGGTGLGLAIVQRIAQIHGARLEVESSSGAGTTVRVRFSS
ncbi:MAG: ATP-binding protein [Thermoanaerobaculia bacterium]|nr:ATP-binding protein [Thermoanaerobaculia bacterium]